MNRQLDIRMLG
ncbi:Protein of unknown function [Bacillus mycoides]|uniref:Uncharacterized protein n=1 Tax=Bacillus mycoides TaxID=1405 RepID=A0A1G4EI04_BACMY|nr:Protein of unknown function [Bacillus mycoides]